MQTLKVIFKWFFRLIVFSALFALALNNKNPVEIHLFFNTSYHAPLIILLLIAFSIGLLFGILGILTLNFNKRKSILNPMTTPTNPSPVHEHTPANDHHTQGKAMESTHYPPPVEIDSV